MTDRISSRQAGRALLLGILTVVVVNVWEADGVVPAFAILFGSLAVLALMKWAGVIGPKDRNGRRT
jgi:hypothetical protein